MSDLHARYAEAFTDKFQDLVHVADELADVAVAVHEEETDQTGDTE